MRALENLAEPVSRYRAAAGSWSATTGKWTPGAEASDTIRAMIQPLTGRTAMGGQMRTELEEGVRNEGHLVIWSLDELKADDVVLYPVDGNRYRVTEIQPWPHGAFWRAVLKLGEA